MTPAERFFTLYPDLCCVVGMDGFIQQINPAFEKILGFATEEVLSRPYVALVHPDEVSATIEALETLRHGITARYHTRYRCKDGSYKWVEWIVEPVLEEGVMYGVGRDITEQKRAEEESENRFRLMADNAPTMLWMTDPTSYCTYLSQGWYDFTGQTEETGLGFGWFDAVHPEDRSHARDVFLEANERRNAFRLEYRLQRHDGEYRRAIDAANPWFGSDGQFLGYIGSVIDITERKRAEEAALEQRCLLKAITDNASVALFIMDQHQQCMFMNPAAEELTGFALDEVQGRALHDVIHHTRPDGSHYPLEECPIDRAFPENNNEQGEEVFVHKDGHFYTVAYTASPLRNAGEIRGTIIEVQDISARKAAEEALRQSEERFRTLAESLPQLVWTATPEGSVDYLNDRWCEFFGVAQKRWYNWQWQEIVHPDDLPHTLEVWSESFRTGKPIELEHRFRHRTGEYRWQLVRGQPFKDDEGRVVKWIGTCTDIHDSKQTTEALLESQKRLALSLRNSPIILYTCDTELRYTWIGKAHPDFRPDELIGRRDDELLPSKDVQDLMAFKRRAIESGTTGRETFWIEIGGKLNTYDITAEPLRGSRGEITGLTVVAFDITERVRRERVQRFLVELSLAAQDLKSPDEIMAVTARMLGQNLGVNRCAYAEVEEDEDHFTVTGDYTRDTFSIVGRFRMASFGEEALRLMRENKPYVVDDIESDERARTNLSAYRQTEIVAVISVPLHKGGRFVAGMAVHTKTPRCWSADEIELVQLVADRCWEAIERARVARKLQESEAQFRQIANSIPQLAWMTDETGWIFWYNKRWFDYTGTTLEEMEGWGWQKVHHPDHVGRVVEKVRHCFETGEVWEDTFPLRGKDGIYRWFLSRAIPLRDQKGNVWRWFGTNTDVTEQRQLAEERKALLDAERDARMEAERVGRMKDEFLATLSHELRTPLNAMLGWSQLLRKGNVNAAKIGQGLDIIERNVRAQAQLIEDLLDVSRIISSKIRLNAQRVDMAGVIEAALETVRLSAETKGIRVQAVLDPSVGVVSGDSVRLQQVIWNLLSNAIKFTPRGGRVEVVLERVDSHIEISVIDTGQGIAPEFLPHVFERFSQADGSTTRTHGGLGLGLSIVRGLTELHGGTVRVKSAGEGKGATFIVSLPFVGVQPEETKPENPDQNTADSSSGGTDDVEEASLSGVKVLVVDDEPDSRELIKYVLEEHKAEVITAASAQQALAELHRERPDVLVSDIGMPEEDGYELIRKVRKLTPEQGGTIPAVALTAYAQAEDKRRALLFGYQMHVPKPVEPSELVAVVSSFTILMAKRREEKL